MLEGFKKGFRIPALGERTVIFAQNLRSVHGMEAVVKDKIAKEVQEARVLGPFAMAPLETLQVSPLGIVPKKAQGEFRLINHLSYPEGNLVNDAISQELCTVHYTSFDEAVNMVRTCDVGAELAKCNIKSAFWTLSVHPRDFDLLGFCFQGSFYREHYLWAAQFHVQHLNGSVPSLTGSLGVEWEVRVRPITLMNFFFVGKGTLGGVNVY